MDVLGALAASADDFTRDIPDESCSESCHLASSRLRSCHTRSYICKYVPLSGTFYPVLKIRGNRSNLRIANLYIFWKLTFRAFQRYQVRGLAIKIVPSTLFRRNSVLPGQKLRKYVPLIPYGNVLLGTIYHRLLKTYGKMVLGTIYHRLKFNPVLAEHCCAEPKLREQFLSPVLKPDTVGKPWMSAFRIYIGLLCVSYFCSLDFWEQIAELS